MTAGEAIDVRHADARDRASIISVLRDAFGQDAEARLVERLWAEKAVTLELVATDRADIIGYCALSLVDAAPDVSGEVFGLAPLAVAPARQRKGVGSMLVRDTLARAKAERAAAIVLVGEPEYYARFGFVAGSAKNVRWEAHDAGDAFQVIDFAGVFDGTARRVNYHPAFMVTV